MGFPIRKSADQSFFAAPRGLSQRSTSFIASQRQGIHRMPLRHLIALIINAHRTRRACRSRTSGGTLMRKTSLLSSRSTRRRAVKLADLNRVCAPANGFRHHEARIDPLFTMSENTRPPQAVRRRGTRIRCSRTSPSDPGWWSQTGSNRRPPACKAGALPAELWPHQGGNGGPGSTRTIDLTLIRGAL